MVHAAPIWVQKDLSFDFSATCWAMNAGELASRDLLLCALLLRAMVCSFRKMFSTRFPFDGAENARINALKGRGAIIRRKAITRHVAFKGGTMLRKMVFGARGRLSTDLDFTARTEISRDDVMTMMLDALAKSYRGLSFQLKDKDWYLTDDGCAANPVCSREDNERGLNIKLRVSLRERPILPVLSQRAARMRARWLSRPTARLPAGQGVDQCGHCNVIGCRATPSDTTKTFVLARRPSSIGRCRRANGHQVREVVDTRIVGPATALWRPATQAGFSRTIQGPEARVKVPRV
jgi:hypothetical protein